MHLKYLKQETFTELHGASHVLSSQMDRIKSRSSRHSLLMYSAKRMTNRNINNGYQRPPKTRKLDEATCPLQKGSKAQS
jgi:hypothetical protein